jgi:hypothetical protein
MPEISRENVVVNDTETEIIEPQDTDKEVDRVFNVTNGESEIEVKAWGSNDNQSWELRDELTISANNQGTLTVGPHVCWVKLVGKTTSPGMTSTVSATLSW